MARVRHYLGGVRGQALGDIWPQEAQATESVKTRFFF